VTDEKKPETAVAKRAALPIALNSSGAMMPSNLPEAIEVAKLMASSGILPKQFDGNTGAVFVAIQMGAEVGLSPMAALQNIAVINGRPSLWGDAFLAVVTAHPDCLDVIETFDDATMTATCIVRRRGRQSVPATFSQADAKTAGLWGKQGPWTQYPKRMLKMRARGFACRDTFPDALRGLHLAEEARDIPDGIDREGIVDAASLEAGDHAFGFTKKSEHKPVELAPAEVKAAVAKTAEKMIKDAKPKAEPEQRDFSGIGPEPMERQPGED
jgi:hypothetical protein